MNLARAVEALQRFALAGVAALLLCAPAGASGSGPLASAAQAESAQAESGPTIVHLLDYVAVDYPATVREGRVVDEAEYREQLEFVGQVVQLLRAMPAVAERERLLQQAAQLGRRIEGKAPAEEVSRAADALRWDVVKVYGLTVAPKRAPNVQAVAALYQAQCAACHGAQGRGDGPAAAGMEPAPANFHDPERMRSRSVYGLYNTITLGVADTPMPGFKQLTEDDRWALAFLVASMRHDAAVLAAGEAAWREGQGRRTIGSLQELVTLSPAEVAAQAGDRAAAAQAWLVAHPRALDEGRPSPLAFARAQLREGLERYRTGDKEGARQLAISAYLEGFELVENSLDAVDGALRLEIEREMMAVRQAIGAGRGADDVAQRVARLEALLDRADAALAEESLSPTAAFVSALLILLREGLEAILVLAAIVAFVRKTGRREAIAYVHVGWIGALVLGFATWAVARYVVDISGASRELTEGVTALLAAAMLLYVGFWLHSKSHAQAWQRFIREQVGGALARRTWWAMAGVSFLAVYRELFEVLLFYQSLWGQAGAGAHTAVLGGMATAAAVLAVLAWAILKYSARLPLGPFFSATSWLLAALAVVFAGNGIAALQEAGVLEATAMRFVSVPVLGLHPTVEGVAAQAATLTLVLAGLWAGHARARREAPAAAG